MKFEMIGRSSNTLFLSRPHYHNSWELCYNTKGTGEWTLGEHTYSFKPGTLVLCPPGVDHSKTSEGGFEDCFLHFTGCDFDPKVYCFKDDYDKKLGQLMQILHTAYYEERSGMVCDALFEAIMGLVRPMLDSPRQNKYVQKLQQTIIAEFSNPDFKLFEANTGVQALEMIQKEDIHLVLLDIMMPQMDGITATAKIREFSNVPIILLTAKSETEDLVLGLNVGADDYITKPFVPLEVLARVRSQLRRYAMLGSRPEPDANILTIGGISLNDRTKTVTVEGDPVSLTPTEYAILHLLMSNPGKVYSTKALYEAVWQEEAMGSEGAVAVHIRHLREKIEIDPKNPKYLKVMWGIGYKIESIDIQLVAKPTKKKYTV